MTGIVTFQAGLALMLISVRGAEVQFQLRHDFRSFVFWNIGQKILNEILLSALTKAEILAGRAGRSG
jgi:hypothetical protein